MADCLFTRLIYILLCSITLRCDILTDYISYYEPLINPKLPFFHIEGKSTLNFEAFGREFQLILVPGSQVFDSTTKITVFGKNNSKSIPSSTINRHLVQGYVKDIRNSSINGYVSEGLFGGVISFPEESYYVEPANNYFNKTKIYFKSVIYRRSDVNISAFLCKDNNESCKPFKDAMIMPEIKGMEFLNAKIDENRNDDDKTKNTTEDFLKNEDGSRNGGVRNVCTLRVIVDHVYYQKVSSHTFENIISRLVVIFNAVDKIFRRADFDLDGMPDDIGFKISEFVIWWSSEQPGYLLTEDFLSSVEYLKLLALDDMSRVCLGFGITARNFGGSVGLAASRQIDAGICAKRSRNGGIRMNVAMATLFLNDEQLPDSFAELVIAHEIGHSFGSGHDPLSMGPCSPSDAKGGVYLMNAVLSNLRLPNNLHFSSCSLQNISKMMKNFGTNCFVSEKVDNFCGNGFVDSPTETCDCGFPAQCDSIDFCCAPVGGLYLDKQCDYRKSNGAECSHRQDACCNTKCRITPAVNKQHCNEREECKQPSYCDGVSKDCPSSTNKPDGTECRQGLGKCREGICEEIICKQAKMEECKCPELKDNCQLCCRFHAVCIQASILGLTMESGVPYSLPDGEPCINGRGVCIRRKCQAIGRMILSEDIKKTMTKSQNQQLMAVVIFTSLISIGIFLLVVLAFCVFKQFKPVRKRHIVKNWSRLRRPRTESTEVEPPKEDETVKLQLRMDNVRSQPQYVEVQKLINQSYISIIPSQNPKNEPLSPKPESQSPPQFSSYRGRRRSPRRIYQPSL